MALWMLVVGLLSKPVLAASCEFEDLQRNFGNGQVVMVDPSDTDADDECCPGQTCGECCTAGTVMPSFSVTDGAISAESISHASGALAFAAAPYPVSIRPPIAG